VLNSSWNNPWKLTSIGLGLVTVTALATGLVVANWTGRAGDIAKDADKPGAVQPTTGRAGQPARLARSQAPETQAPAASPGVPTQSTIDACNQQAASEAGHRDKTGDTVKDAGVGAIAGAALGAATGAIAGGGRGAGKGAAIGGIVGAGGGTLYGLNENKKHDERYRQAYAACMHSRGYTG